MSSSRRDTVFCGEPITFIMGCRAWPPPPDPGGRCGVCHQPLGRRSGELAGAAYAVCGACHAATLPLLRLIRVKETGRNNSTRGDADRAERDAGRALRKQYGTRLSERERRRLWNGYKGVLDRELTDVSSRARVGRDFLTSIGQRPDFDLILDKRGNVVGRKEPEPKPCDGDLWPAASPSASA